MGLKLATTAVSFALDVRLLVFTELVFPPPAVELRGAMICALVITVGLKLLAAIFPEEVLAAQTFCRCSGVRACLHTSLILS
jgi:hypothetical protein